MNEDPSSGVPPKRPPSLERFKNKRDLVTPDAGTRATDESADSPTVIGSFAKRALLEQGVDSSQFLWHVPVLSMVLGSGQNLDGGVLATVDSETLYLFRYTPKEGFQIASFTVEDLLLDISLVAQDITLEFTVSDSPVSTFKLRIDCRCLRESTGPWFDFIKPVFTAELGIDDDAPIFIGSLKLTGPKQDDFGVSVMQDIGVAIFHIYGLSLRMIPEVKLPGDASISAWCSMGNGIVLTYMDPNSPRQCSIEDIGRYGGQSIQKLLSELPRELLDPEITNDHFESLGSFQTVEGGVEEHSIILHRQESSVTLYGDHDATDYIYACVLPGVDTTILGGEGDCILGLRMGSAKAEEAFKSLLGPAGFPLSEAGVFWGFALDETSPVRFKLKDTHFQFGDVTLLISDAGDIHVAQVQEGLCEVTLKTEGAQSVEYRLTMQRATAFRLWEEWEVRRAAVGIASSGPAELYRQFNQAKKHNMLILMFGDILLLNRLLDAEITMKDLIQKMEAVGAVKFAEDDKLRDATVSKILLLTSALNTIKQRLELLATMAPYYWAEEEAKWLSDVFGSKAVADCVVQERKRLVPIVRRQIRLSQSDMMRCLTQIEMAARPLEAIFAREEIRKHWSSKVRLFLPAVSQLAIGGAMIAAQNHFGWAQIGSAIGIHGAGGILSVFQKDREATAQVRRAAENILPWWQVFMRTLVVSIFQSSEFMDSENNHAMTRDKCLLDSTAERRDSFDKRLQSQLRRRILNERRNLFVEVIPDSGIRLADVVDDIDHAIGFEMPKGINDFSKTLLTGNKHQAKDPS